MADFWGSLGSTLKSIGSAAEAPQGLVYDLASMPFDNKADNFGSVLQALGNRFHDVTDPFSNDNTWTGSFFGHLMHGLDVAKTNAISHPVSTFGIMMSHVDSGGGNSQNPFINALQHDPNPVAGLAGSLLAPSHQTHYGDLTDPHAWAQAYDLAKRQSIGQTVAFAVSNTDDPFNFPTIQTRAKDAVGNPLTDKDGNAVYNYSNPYDQTFYKEHPLAATLISGATDFAVSWYLDPGVLLGKAAGAYSQTANFRNIHAADRVDALAKMTGATPDPLHGMARGLKLVPIFGSRVANKVGMEGGSDTWAKYVFGANKTGLPLNPVQIKAVTPELAHSAEGLTIAKAVYDAGVNISDPAARLNETRRILAIGIGDPVAVQQLRAGMGPTARIADALTNALKGDTLNLKGLATDPTLATDPAYIADLERQLTNVNDKGGLDKFVSDFVNKLDDQGKRDLALSEATGTLQQLPLAHVKNLPGGLQTGASARALKRETGTRLIDKFNQGEQSLEDWARTLKADPRSNVFQKGINSVPLVVVKAGAFSLSPWSKWPVGFADKLRNVHYQGVANLHDWTGATDQLNAMMLRAGVDDSARSSILSDTYGAVSEADKKAAIERVEMASKHALVTKYADKFGVPESEISRDFINSLMAQGFTWRQKYLTQLGGQAYAATELPADAMSGRMQELADQNPGTKWRVDQVPAEDGTPIALPLISTQLANKVPLMDVDLLDRIMGRASTFQRFVEHGKAWQREATYATGLRAAMLNAGAAGQMRMADLLKGSYKAMDALNEASQTYMKVWKFMMLFRLGFTQRVLGDDQMRIGAQMNYFKDFAHPNAAEATRNFLYNHRGQARAKVGAWWNSEKLLAGDGRYSDAARVLKTADAERQRLLISLYGDDRARNLSSKDWTALNEAIPKALEGDSEAITTVGKLDPEHRVYTYYSRKREVQALQKSLKGLTGKESVDAQAAIAHLMEQMGEEDPAQSWKQIEELTSTLSEGVSLKAKRHLGEEPVKMAGGYDAPGAFGGPEGEAFYEGAKGNGSYQTLVNGIEDKHAATLGHGSYETKQPGQPGHLEAWADVLNHQFRMSPEAMFFIKDPTATAEDFARWIMEPGQRILRDRVSTYARDPLGWGKRVEAYVRDYIPNEDLRKLVRSGTVTAKKLRAMFPNDADRPWVHGQQADIATGRHPVVRAMSSFTDTMYKVLADLPTDHLTRHPYFNTLYKSALKDQHESYMASLEAGKIRFGPDDMAAITRSARKVALNHIRETLFDVSSHSQAAHMLRFISPFFAAHQEAMTRWWKIAGEHPDVIRKFQLIFDAPARMSTPNVPLIYDVSTGEPVQPGEGISQNHQILLRVPEMFGGTKSPIDGWLKKLGGDKYWQVSQNGFNIVLQSGIFNPGIGPVVSVPLEALIRKYADKQSFVTAVRALNPYPPNSPLGGAVPLPTWAQRAWDGIHHGHDWAYSYQQNLHEEFVQFQLDHNGAFPTSNQKDTMAERAGKEATRDVLLRALSNAVTITPMRPGSKYAVIQNGWTKIQQTADAKGYDYQWMLDQFKEKYGSAYMALVYSDSLNPGALTGTAAEVSAVKRFNPLIQRVDPKLVKMIVGPTAAQAPADDQAYSSDARQWLERAQSGALDGSTLIDTKTPEASIQSIMVNSGWAKYSALTSALQIAAEARGYSSYAYVKDLTAIKDAAVQSLSKENFAWYEDYKTRSAEPYQTYLDGMQKIAADKALWKDPTRVGDVSALKKYLTLRSTIDLALQARGASGGSKGYNAQSNSDLMQMLLAGVSSFRQQSTYFDDYYYNGIIDHDPYIVQAITEAQAGALK